MEAVIILIMENSLTSERVIIQGLQSEVKRLKEELEETTKQLAAKDRQLSIQIDINSSLETRNKMQKNKLSLLEEKAQQLEAGCQQRSPVRVQEPPRNSDQSQKISELSIKMEHLSEQSIFLQKQNEQLRRKIGEKQKQMSSLEEKYCEIWKQKIELSKDYSELQSKLLNSSNQSNSSFFDFELAEKSCGPQPRIIRREPNEEAVKEEQNPYVPSNTFAKTKKQEIEVEPQAQLYEPQGKVSNVNFDDEDLQIEPQISKLNRRVFGEMSQHLQALPPSSKLMFLQMVSVWSESRLDRFVECVSDLQ